MAALLPMLIAAANAEHLPAFSDADLHVCGLTRASLEAGISLNEAQRKALAADFYRVKLDPTVVVLEAREYAWGVAGRLRSLRSSNASESFLWPSWPVAQPPRVGIDADPNHHYRC